MKKTYLILLLIGGTYFFSGSCGKGGDTPPPSNDPCAGVSVSVNGTVTDATTGASNGSITISSPSGTGITYSINSGAFGASSSFTGLASGTYTITAKTAAGCTGSRQFTVNSDACAGKVITLTASGVTGNTPCSPSNTGSFTINAVGSTGFTYSLGAGAFQASNIFTGLATGSYTVNAKDGDGCIKSTSVSIGNTPAGPLFASVRSMMQSNCAIPGCHVNPGPTGGLNFQDDCTIVNNWDRIKARAVDGNPSFMPPPPNPQLSATDKQKIVDWIAAGHKYTD